MGLLAVDVVGVGVGSDQLTAAVAADGGGRGDREGGDDRGGVVGALGLGVDLPGGRVLIGDQVAVGLALGLDLPGGGVGERGGLLRRVAGERPVGLVLQQVEVVPGVGGVLVGGGGAARGDGVGQGLEVGGGVVGVAGGVDRAAVRPRLGDAAGAVQHVGGGRDGDRGVAGAGPGGAGDAGGVAVQIVGVAVAVHGGVGDPGRVPDGFDGAGDHDRPDGAAAAGRVEGDLLAGAGLVELPFAEFDPGAAAAGAGVLGLVDAGDGDLCAAAAAIAVSGDGVVRAGRGCRSGREGGVLDVDAVHAAGGDVQVPAEGVGRAAGGGDRVGAVGGAAAGRLHRRGTGLRER